MRFDPETPRTASYFVNEITVDELAEILYRYGEEHQAKRIARAIVASRPISSTVQLAAVVERAIGRRKRPATKTFMALRIAVNDELKALSDALPQALNVLASGGRLAVISYHSLEDRIVKGFFRRESKDCLCPPEAPICTCNHKATLKILSPKPIRPSAEEVARNPRSRSAKLRIAYRI
jgi:16S rRNA (cytosine1402-N4)-methyltransferase